MIKQQIVVSGLGGQGVLFITRLLAEAAMANKYPVLTSETHGMAQRGGTVVSHLKAGDFSSPLIRPGSANALIALKPETMAQHQYFTGPCSWIVVNSDETNKNRPDLYHVDADIIAKKLENSGSVNLVMLGAAIAIMKSKGNGVCSRADIIKLLKNRLKKKKKGILESAIKTLDHGYSKFT